MGDTSRSRNDRLRELERERMLYAQSRPLHPPSHLVAAHSATIPLQQQQHQQHQLWPEYPSTITYSPPRRPHSVVYAEPRVYTPSPQHALHSPTRPDIHLQFSNGPSLPAAYVPNDHTEGIYESQLDDTESTDSVCYAAEEGGLRGKIRLTRDGKHSFVDLDSSARGIPPPSNPNYTGATTTHSLSKSLADMAKLEKSRIKSERLAKEHSNATRTSSMSEKRSSPSHLDAFSKLIAKDQKSRAKFLVSERALLEEERTRYMNLEDAYTKLLSQVQHLQQSHLQDLRNTESRYHTSSSTLQKALVLKSEDTVTLSHKLADVQSRYERDTHDWEQQRLTLTTRIDLTDKTQREMEATLRDRDGKLTELHRLRKDLAERVATREQELVKYAKALRDREGDWIKEKEAHTKAEVRVLKLEETLTETNAEASRIKIMLEAKLIEVEELGKTKSLLSDARREVEDLSRREKTHLSEIDQATARERTLLGEIEGLSSLQRQYVQEISRLTSKQNSLMQDLELVKSFESKLRQELDDTLMKNSQQVQDLGDLEKQARQFQNDGARLLRDVSELESILQDARVHNQSLEKDLQQHQMANESLKADKDALIIQNERIESERNNLQREVDDLSVQVNELARRFEAELNAKAEMRQQNKDKLMGVSLRISELQSTLSETQVQLEDLRENESTLRQTVRQREETIRSQTQSIVDAQTKLADLQSQVSKDNQEFDAYKAKKREEILSIQEKLGNSKTSLEHEVGSLRSQLQQKLLQISNLSEEASKTKAELSELSADRFSLDTRVSELLASEASYQRQISNLQASVNQKGQEAARMVAKHRGLADQMRRLEDEIQAYRGSSAASNVRDGEISRLQNNMDEISRKLKSQVDLLLERDFDSLKVSNGSGGSGNEYSAVSTGNISNSGLKMRVGREFEPTALGNHGLGSGSSPHSRAQISLSPERNTAFFSGAGNATSPKTRTNGGMANNNNSGGNYVGSSIDRNRGVSYSPMVESSSGIPRSLDRQGSRKIVGIDGLDEYDRLSNATNSYATTQRQTNLNRSASPNSAKNMN
ncbi:hypothetical protein BASA62_004173 [Batrachochytrium salamandrivorans]|nr:hypothetical protein BASA62_004173 [Batrachochytrium salamandrivorans]